MRWRFYDYRCPCGWQGESFEDRSDPPDSILCQSCKGGAERIFSAPKLGTNWIGDVVRGKSDERPHEGILDTRALAEGMPRSEWRAKRAAYWRDKDLAENKKLLG